MRLEWLLLCLCSARSLQEWACDDPIFCIGGPGSLLHEVQLRHPFNDSKTFVDLKMSNQPDVILSNFKRFMTEHKDEPTKHDLLNFLGENFDLEKGGLLPWSPSDWKSQISLYSKIADPLYKGFAQRIHKLWKSLGRQIDPELDESKTTLIKVNEPFIVPGGRFRGFYYWDTYWIMLGLIGPSEMKETAKGMLRNFAQLIEKFGMIPNGNRKYFSKRSQPPLFIKMVDLYLTYDYDVGFLREMLPAMTKEFNFWLNNRTSIVSNGNSEHLLARYIGVTDTPRPESYAEDYFEAREYFRDEESIRNFYKEVVAACESGWDFSSKWLRRRHLKSYEGLKDINTHNVYPVELNSYLCQNAFILAKYSKKLGNTNLDKHYRDLGERFKKSIATLLWNPRDGMWYDWNAKTGQSSDFYPSNLSPLWSDCVSLTETEAFDTPKLLNYLKSRKVFHYPGGVMTSQIKTGQQWDYSDAWPPLQEMIVTSLENLIKLDPISEDLIHPLIFNLVSKWVKTNFLAFEKFRGFMFEKYDAFHQGQPGGSGEYTVQAGFGWTNGVILHFLNKYGREILLSDQHDQSQFSMLNLLFIIPFMWFLTLMFGARRVTRKRYFCGLMSLSLSCACFFWL